MQWSESVVGGGNAAGKAIRAKAESCTPATMDNSLTNLNWLPDFRVPSIDGKEKSIDLLKQGSELTVSDSASSTGSTTLESEVERDECLLPLSPIKRCLNQTAEFEKNPLRFEEDPNKPPFSYTTIIYLAIRSCEKDKVMLSDIYQWIRDHFKYYRIAEPTWQNSVRHNLSLNQFFRKIPRGEGDPGKGSFWQINPEYEHLLNNDYELHRLVQQQSHIKLPSQRKKSKGRKRIQSSNSATSPKQTNKKCTSAREKRPHSACPSSTADPCHLPGDLDWVSLLSSQKVGCISCNEFHHCRPSFGSPVLGTPDLGHIGDPITCSPAVVPVTLMNRIPDTPPLKNELCNSLEEIITTQESPAPLLPPWAAESRPYFNEHPWAETNHISPLTRRKQWSPEDMWGGTATPNTDRPNKLQIAQLI